MLTNEFKINEVDKAIYLKNRDKYYVIVCFYMDNILMLINNNYMIKSNKKILINKFDMKYLTVVNVMLWIKITRTYNGLILSHFY